MFAVTTRPARRLFLKHVILLLDKVVLEIIELEVAFLRTVVRLESLAVDTFLHLLTHASTRVDLTILAKILLTGSRNIATLARATGTLSVSGAFVAIVR